MGGEVMIVCGMVVVIAAVLYAIIRGLWRGPKLPAMVLLAATLLFVMAGLVHDFTESDVLRSFVMRLMIVFVPLAIGAYSHALRFRSGL